MEAADTFVEAENTVAEAAGTVRRCLVEALVAVGRMKGVVGMLAAVAVDMTCCLTVAGLAEVVALVVAARSGSAESKSPIYSCLPTRVAAMLGRQHS